MVWYSLYCISRVSPFSREFWFLQFDICIYCKSRSWRRSNEDVFLNRCGMSCDLADIYVTGLQHAAGPIKHASQWWPSLITQHDPHPAHLPITTMAISLWYHDCPNIKVGLEPAGRWVHLLCNHLKTCQKLFLPPLCTDGRTESESSWVICSRRSTPQSAEWKNQEANACM